MSRNSTQLQLYSAFSSAHEKLTIYLSSDSCPSALITLSNEADIFFSFSRLAFFIHEMFQIPINLAILKKNFLIEKLII